MKLRHIDLNDLKISPLNVRKYGAKDCTDLVTSIAAMGLLQPLLVRPNCEGFEVVAGQRRLTALQALAGQGEADPVPCLVMERGDDAAAIEASLAENIERLPMDEIDQYKAFAKLVAQGRSVEDIAISFGVTERMVSQRLALGRLHPPILTAYRKGDLHGRDLKFLTMASATQQKAWWALVKDENGYAPTGRALRDWLFGGSQIPVRHALFDAEASGLKQIADLFDEDSYFADSEAFWPLQNAAIAELAESYRAKGWQEVNILDVGEYWSSWEHVATAKKDGGRVHITCTNQGEVDMHEGFLTQKEAKGRAKGEPDAPAKAKPELTKAAQNYFDLHRHAAVRADLLGRSDLALRLIVAHLLAGSSLWSVEADPQKSAKPEIAESLAANKAETRFAEERTAIAELLGLESETSLLGQRGIYAERPDLGDIYSRVLELDDDTVTRILTFLMAESLEAGTAIIDRLGGQMETDLAASWAPDDTFLDLMRDKRALNAMVAEAAGTQAAKEHVTATAKMQKAIIKACLDGTRTAATPNWMPRYALIPMGFYAEETEAA
jgi:ParB family chromosome partitioning protein